MSEPARPDPKFLPIYLHHVAELAKYDDAMRIEKAQSREPSTFYRRQKMMHLSFVEALEPLAFPTLTESPEAIPF